MFMDRLVITSPLASSHCRFSALHLLSPKVAPRFHVAIWFPVFFKVIATSPEDPGYRVAAGFARMSWSSVAE